MPEEPSNFRVDRCVCVGRDFGELLGIADKHRYTFEQLCQKTGCCRGCGFCTPYVQRVLVTRETSLPLVPQAQAMTGEQIEARVTDAAQTEESAATPEPAKPARRPRSLKGDASQS